VEIDAVEIDRHLHVGFLGASLDRALAHEWVLRNEPRAFYQGLTAFATLTRPAFAPSSDNA
jgi:hypothetical protein